MIREESGEPARGEGGGEGEVERSAVAGRGEDPLFEEGGDDAAGLAFAGVEDGFGLAPGEFTTEEQGVEQGEGLGREVAEAGFLFGPDLDADAESGGLDEALHELDLIQAEGEEELGEFAEGFFAEVAAAV